MPVGTRVTNNMKRYLFLLIGLIITVMLFACNRHKQYKIECLSSDFFFSADQKPAPTKAKAGEKVVLYFPYVATDTDYRFFVDDEPINVQYTDEGGYIIRFTMPEHDVQLYYTMRNTMMYNPDENLLTE